MVTHVFDPVNNLREIINGRSGGLLTSRFTYTYDGMGNRTTQVDLAGVRTTWTYDPTYQLLEEVRGGLNAFNISYQYDETGNRLLEMQPTVGAVSYLYDAGNQLLEENSTIAGVTTYTYDEDGNRTRKDGPAATTFYQWDEENRLVQAEPPAGVFNFQYNADGQRVQKESPTEVLRYIYDMQRLLQETDDDDEAVRDYTFAPISEYGDLVSEYGDDESSYHTYDAQWSTEALLDDSESATARFQYKAFGELSAESGDGDTALKFVGKQGYYQETELDLYCLGIGNNSGGGRLYDPAHGRFLSQDPKGFGGGDINLYRYVGNNPINVIDPSGQVPSPQMIDMNSEGFSPNPPSPAKPRVAFSHNFLREGYCGYNKYDFNIRIAPTTTPTSSVATLHWLVSSYNYITGGSGYTQGESWLGGTYFDNPRTKDQPIVRTVPVKAGHNEQILVNLSKIKEELSKQGSEAFTGDMSWDSTLSSIYNRDQINDWWARQGGREPYKWVSGGEAGLEAFAKEIKNNKVLCSVLSAATGKPVCDIISSLFTNCGRLISSLGADVKSIGNTLYFRGPDVMKVFSGAMDKTLTEFKKPETLLETLLEGFLGWLKLDQTAKTAFGNVFGAIKDTILGKTKFLDALYQIIPDVLSFFKLTKDNLFATVKGLLADIGVPDPLLMAFMGVVDAMFGSEVGSPGESKNPLERAWTYIKNTFADAVGDAKEGVSTFFSEFTTCLFKPACVIGKFQDLLIGTITGAVEQLIRKVVGGLASGGIYTVILTTLDVLSLIGNACEGVNDVIDKIARALKFALANPKGAVDTVYKAIKDSLAVAAKMVIKFLAGTIGAHKLPDQIEETRNAIADPIKDLLKNGLNAVKGGIKGTLDNLMQKFGLASKPLVAPIKGKGHEIENGSKVPTDVSVTVDENGEVFLQWNPTCTLTNVNKANKDHELSLPAGLVNQYKSAQGAEKLKKYNDLVVAVKELVSASGTGGNYILSCCGDESLRPTAPPPCPVSKPTYGPLRVQIDAKSGTPFSDKVGTSATATIATPLKTGDEFDTWPDWWTSLPAPLDDWRRGHLLGRQFGGAGGSAYENLAPIFFLVNNSAMATCENRIRSAIKCGHCVTISVTAVYLRPTDIRPQQIRIVATSPQGLKIDVTIPNDISPGVPIACSPTGGNAFK